MLSNSESTRDDSKVFQEAISRCIFYGADELLFASNNGKKYTDGKDKGWDFTHLDDPTLKFFYQIW